MLDANEDPRLQPRRAYVSVVIPARNAAASLGAQLESLSGQRDPGVDWEIVVADNGSTDGTRDLVLHHAAQDPRIRCVDASRAPGVNVARNVGTEHAEGRWIALCDADDVVDPDWLHAHVSAFSESGADLLGGRLVPILGPSGRSFGRSTSAFDQSAPHPMRFLPMAPGANMCYSRAAWKAVSGFDESWDVPGNDDLDFSWRVQLHGFSFQFVPEAVVFYRFRDSRAGSVRQAFLYCVASPKVYGRFRSAGARRRSIAGALRSWLTLVLTSWQVVSSTDARDRWLHRLAKNAGYLVGSLRFRVFYP